MRSPLAVMHIDTGREMRGGQRQVLLLSRGLAGLGHRIVVVVPERAPLAAALKGDRTVETLELPIRGELSPGAARALARRLKGEPFDLLHTHTPHAITLAQLSRRLAGSPLLVAHRRVAFPLKRNVLSRWKRRWPDHWIAVAGVVREHLERDGIPPSKISVVPSCLDPQRRVRSRSRGEVRATLGIAEDAFVLCSVGHLAEHKGHRVLLLALGDAALAGRPWSLLLVGDGEERQELASLAGDLGIAGRVSFLGWREDVPDLLGAADLFVFPSISGEGSPAAVKEALAAGVPVRASDLRAHAELGLPPEALFPNGDAAALARMLSRALDGEGLAPVEGDLPARFTPNVMVAETQRIYEELLGRRGQVSRA